MEGLINDLSESLGILYYVLVYAVGVVAVCFSITSFQMKRRFLIVILNCFGQLAWVVYFLLQADLVSAIACGLSALMLAVFSQKERWAWSCGYISIGVFITVLTGFSIISFKVWSDIFPIFAGIFAVIANSRTDERTLRIFAVPWCLSWMFNSICKLYPIALFNDVFCAVSAILALVRYREKGTDTECEKAKIKKV